MKRTQIILYFITFCFTLYSCAIFEGNSKKVNVRLEPILDSQIFTLNEEDLNDPFWSFEFEVEVINNSKNTIKIISPYFKGITPNPWIECINETKKRNSNWVPHGIPKLKESHKIEILLGEKQNVMYSKVLAINDLKEKTTEYRIKLKYEFELEKSSVYGGSMNDLTQLKTDWSSEIIVQIQG